MKERRYRLSARFVATVDQPGCYGDGGLFVRVKHRARGHLAKFWAQRTSAAGRQRNFGLGYWPHVGVAEAREKFVLNLTPPRREVQGRMERWRRTGVAVAVEPPGPRGAEASRKAGAPD